MDNKTWVEILNKSDQMDQIYSVMQSFWAGLCKVKCLVTKHDITVK